MATNTLASLVAAMVRFLQSSGFSLRELSHRAQVPEEGLKDPDANLTPEQIQTLWQLIQSRLLPRLSFSLQIRQLIADQLRKGRVGVDVVADQLHMSRQTLYQRLKQENQTFKGLLDDVRREQALAYLRDPERPLVEVAELLGFSEVSAFSRAFKRWMGQPPASYRAAQGVAAA